LPNVEYESNFAEVAGLITDTTADRLAEIGQQFVAEWRRNISRRAGGGRQYPHPFGGTYRASAPGEFPVYRTGSLHDSTEFDVEMTEDSGTLAVGSDAEVALWLELGTYKMAPRPHLRRTFEQQQSNIVRLLESRWF